MDRQREEDAAQEAKTTSKAPKDMAKETGRGVARSHVPLAELTLHEISSWSVCFSLSSPLLLVQTKIFGFKARRLRMIQETIQSGITLITVRIQVYCGALVGRDSGEGLCT